MSLRNIGILSLLTAVVVAAAFAGKASASVSQFTLSVDNNIVAHKDAPNLQFTILETNNSGAPATCSVNIPELNNFWTSPVEIASGATTGLGSAYPSTKKSKLTFYMWCDGNLVATATSKVTLTGQISQL